MASVYSSDLGVGGLWNWGGGKKVFPWSRGGNIWLYMLIAKLMGGYFLFTGGKFPPPWGPRINTVPWRPHICLMVVICASFSNYNQSVLVFILPESFVNAGELIWMSFSGDDQMNTERQAQISLNQHPTLSLFMIHFMNNCYTKISMTKCRT